MADGLAINMVGVAELRAKLRRLQDTDLNNALKKIHKELAEEVIKIADPNVPVRTGRLKASLRGSGTLKNAVGRVGSASVPYAPIVHWKYGPPFLTDAAAKIEPGVVDRFDAAIAEQLDRTIGR